MKKLLFIFALFLYAGSLSYASAEDDIIIDFQPKIINPEQNGNSCRETINEERNNNTQQQVISTEQNNNSLQNVIKTEQKSSAIISTTLNSEVEPDTPDAIPFEFPFDNNTIIYSEYYLRADAINPGKNGENSYYPGSRGPNQLIVYTPAYGMRTGTNEFGTEAIVEDNMVVSMNGADSLIPRNGFVISGHGRAKTRIQNSLQIGSKVYIDYPNRIIRVFLTPDSLVFAAKEKLKEVNELVDYYRKTDRNYEDKNVSNTLDNSVALIDKAEKSPEKAHEYISSALEYLDNAIKNAIPYRKDELKGIWLRPIERNEEDIRKTVERLNNAGVTDVFLETYYHGKTIYPSEYLKSYGVIEQRPEFVGFDPLDTWMKEAHKRNMKVHIWFETYYVGNENPRYTRNHVLNLYPSWSNKRLSTLGEEGPVSSPSEHNGYFLDPANYRVKTYLLGLIEEIITKYRPDGINLDYIRYPQTIDANYTSYTNANWGYTECARGEFMGLYGIDPAEIKYGDPEWETWAEFRQNKITDFIAEVKKITSKNNVLLTAVIFPDLRKCKATKMQNWQKWSLDGDVDGLTPLLLTGDSKTAEVLLKDIVNNTSNFTKIYPGLFVTFLGGTYDELLMQIQKSREFRAKGTVIFDYAHFHDNYADALKTRIYNKYYGCQDLKNKNRKKRK